MTIRVTITKPGVTDAYGIAMVVGTTYTVEENFGLSLIQQGRASDTDEFLDERINAPFDEVVYPIFPDDFSPVGLSVDGTSLVSGDRNFSVVGGIRDYADLVAALAETATAAAPKKYAAVPGVTITLADPITINTATCAIDFQGALIDASAITGNSKAITLTYEPSDFSAWQKYAQSRLKIENFALVGPGRNAAANIDAGDGTHGIYTQGRVEVVLANRPVRPSISNFVVSGFDHGFTCDDVSFLGQLENPTIYDCRVGWRQLAATDSGENYRIFGGITQRCELGWLLEDGSSEWFVHGHSVDYGIQLCLLRPSASWARLGFTDCHIETRGDELGSDAGWYVSQGTGTDSRVPVPLRDSFIDVDGTGSFVYFHGGLLDLNDSGGAGPWTFSKLINVRHKNSGVRFLNCSPQSLQNTANLFSTGPGYVKHEGGQLMFPSSLTVPARLSDNPLNNRLFDAAIPTANIRDLWTIRRDTAEITNRWTGTNGSLARDNGITRAITIDYALTMSGTGLGTQTVTANSSLPAFSPMMLGRNFVVGSGVGSITSVDSESQITISVSVAFASTSIASGAAVARNTASLKVTKVGASGTNFEAMCLIPCRPGERLTVHGYYWIKAAGGLSGTPAVNTRWAKRGMDKVAALAGASAATYLQNIPTEGYADTAGSDWDIGSARDAAVIRTVDLAVTPTNTWIEFVLTVPNDSANGAMQCPEWSDCMEFVVNLNSANAGDIHLGDLTVSAW